ncbi:MAG: hypothetical protein EAZ85_15150 [Bacteroidetes bacterium]|nr:MAG: hypothetical protein EAZ85_15150 [Bacteroidota bacterium]TAG88327.1 MAG: hypothetical protein EAZ20_08730 [Bacteroidota bacterium]
MKISLLFKISFYIIGFLISLKLLILSFKTLHVEIIESVILATANPFIALFIGILITALLQSSSTVTSALVAAVASGMITTQNAVYLIMGANIGTTVTSTIVSLGHIMRKKEFRRAFAAATLHDFFNILTAIILFPLEYYFNTLSNLTKYFTHFFVDYKGFGIFYLVNPVTYILEPITQTIYVSLGEISWLALVVAVASLFLMIRGMSMSFKQSLQQNFEGVWEKYLFGSAWQSLLSGILITAFVHSSSLVTSLVVPIVASNRLSVRRCFPFLMGANIGTTITALLAALPQQNEAALQIAFVHIFFNIIGVMIFFPILFFRNIPIFLARNLGKLAIKNRIIGLIYITFVFFLLPFLLIWFSKSQIKIISYQYKNKTEKAEKTTFLKAEIINVQTKHNQNEYFYKQVSLQKSPFESHILIIKEEKDFFYIENQKFFVGNINQFKTFEDKKGKYTMKIIKIIKKYEIHQNLSFKNVIVFEKKYLKNKLFVEYFYIDIQEKIYLKYEKYAQKGNFLGKEEFIWK